MSGRTLVFVPVFNCRKQLPRVLRRLLGAELSGTGEILVIDNRSTDGTVEAAAEWLVGHGDELARKGWPVKVLRNRSNFGLGGSHKIAFNYCLDRGFDACMVLHGDDQARVSDLEKMLASPDDCECLLGGRFAPGARLEGYSGFRKIGNRALNALFSCLTEVRVYDLGAGLNLYRRRYLEDRAYMAFRNDLTFNVYLLLHALLSGAAIRFIPIHWGETDQVSNARVVRQGLHCLGLFRRALFRPADFTCPPRNDLSLIAYGSDQVYP